MARTREVKFYNDGVYYASITIVFAEDGKKQYIPSPGYELCPMDIDDVDLGMYGYDPDLVVYSMVGNKRRRSYLVPAPEKVRKAVLRSDWAESKQEERQCRCMITGKDGRPVVCSRKSCYGCENAYQKGTAGRLVSLDALQEDSHWDPAALCDDFNTPERIIVSNSVEDQFVEELQGIQEKLAKIYVMDRVGYSIPEISKALGVTERTIYNDRKRIEEYRAKFAKRFI